MQHQRWEYRVIERIFQESYFESINDQVEKYLNTQGEDGLELVTVHHDGRRTRTFTFKRPIPEE